MTRVNGHPGVLLRLTQQNGANTTAIADAIHLPAAGEVPLLDQIAAYLSHSGQESYCLLILDNFEHLIEPGAAIVAGLKAVVVPAGKPDAESETVELNGPEIAVVIVEVPDAPWLIVSVGVDEVIEKFGLNWISMTG